MTVQPVGRRFAKRLVAVVDGMEGDGLDEHPEEPFDLPGYWGLPPDDGDLVGIPTPCARVRAGYFCMCAGSFRAVRGHVPMTRARVEVVTVPIEEPDGVPYIDEPSPSAVVPEPTEDDRAALARMLEDLPVGTIVERRGVGFGPLYRPQVGARAGRSSRSRAAR